MTFISEVLADSPVGFWEFNNDLTDSSGNGLDMSALSFSPDYVTSLDPSDPSGSPAALHCYDSSLGHYTNGYRPYDAALAFSGDITIEFLMASSAANGNYRGLVGIWNSLSQNSGWFVRLDPSNHLTVRFCTSSGDQEVNTSAAVVTDDGTMYHIVARLSGTTASLWVDGTKVAEATGLVPNQGVASTYPLYTGIRAIGDEIGEHITLDNLAIYSSPLSDARIAAHYAALSGGGGGAATITSLSPTSGPVGQSVVITGTNLTNATDVTFNGTSAASFTVDSDTQITAVVDTGTTTGAVVVLSPDGDSTDDPTFTVTAPPTITSLSPTSGPVGQSVVITGTNLDTVTAVDFNGTAAASFTDDSTTQVTAVVDTGTATGAVHVTNPDGTSTDDPTFTVTIPPTITSVDITSGPIGTDFIITGTDFTDATAVKINGTDCFFVVLSDTEIAAVVLAGTTDGAITVETPDGTATGPDFDVIVVVPAVPDGGAGGVRISIAFTDPVLEPDPTWTDVTALERGLTAGYDIERGRQDEMDYTDTGNYTITVYDKTGILDPTNVDGPMYGNIDCDLQVMIELWNPVAGTWSTRFRGWIETYDYDVDGSQRLSTLTITCYDIFALLSLIEMQPGAFGDPVPPSVVGNIFFKNDTFQDRIINVLANALGTGYADWAVVFSGNVQMLPCVYAPGDTPMNVVQDALDAEFPGVSNAYQDRFGRLAIHGRLAKFDPAGTLATSDDDRWLYRVWHVGDEAARIANPSLGFVQMREPYSWNLGRSKLINSAMAYPPVGINGMTDALIPGQLVQDLDSIALRGYGSWSRENIQIAHGTLTGNTGIAECKLFCEFFKANYAFPRPRVTALTVKSIYPKDERANRVWDMLSNVDIADKLFLNVTHPGGGGFGIDEPSPWYVEGIHETAEPADRYYAMVTLSLDVSPATFFDPDNDQGMTTPS